jgi:hypothetical protein
VRLDKQKGHFGPAWVCLEFLSKFPLSSRCGCRPGGFRPSAPCSSVGLTAPAPHPGAPSDTSLVSPWRSSTSPVSDQAPRPTRRTAARAPPYGRGLTSSSAGPARSSRVATEAGGARRAECGLATSVGVDRPGRAEAHRSPGPRAPAGLGEARRGHPAAAVGGCGRGERLLRRLYAINLYNSHHI